MPITRRELLAIGAVGLVARPAISRASAATPLERQVGITTGSFSPQLRENPARFQLPELLKIIRDELDMRVVDVYTPSLASFEPEYLDGIRLAAEHAGCTLTNLKLNQSGLEMGSRDEALRERSLAEYERSIDAAARLGMRWVRPLPGRTQGDLKLIVAGYHRLMDYARPRGIKLLVENFGWMQSDPEAVTKLLDAIGGDIAASPDTGNWQSNEVRYAGLAKTFPRAVTCDFKAFELAPGGEHQAYDLKRCFTIGWDAGFRGPWCLEHGNPDTKQLFSKLRLLRDQLHHWIAERS
jgi:hypothetical protein